MAIFNPLCSFASAAAPRIAVASLDQMLSLDPADIFIKIRVLAGIVVGLFGLMNAGAAVAYALDLRYRSKELRALLKVKPFGFRAHRSGAWTWHLVAEQGEGRTNSGGKQIGVDGVGQISGPFAQLSAVIGLPPVRIRSAIPDEMFKGSVGASSCAADDAAHDDLMLPFNFSQLRILLLFQF